MDIRGMKEALNDARVVTYGPVLLPNNMTASSDDVPTPDPGQKNSPRFRFPVKLRPRVRDA